MELAHLLPDGPDDRGETWAVIGPGAAVAVQRALGPRPWTDAARASLFEGDVACCVSRSPDGAVRQLTVLTRVAPDRVVVRAGVGGLPDTADGRWVLWRLGIRRLDARLSPERAPQYGYTWYPPGAPGAPSDTTAGRLLQDEPMPAWAEVKEEARWRAEEHARESTR